MIEAGFRQRIPRRTSRSPMELRRNSHVSRSDQSWDDVGEAEMGGSIGATGVLDGLPGIKLRLDRTRNIRYRPP
jgi:hypothetical protein